MQINYQPTKRVFTPVGVKSRTKQSFRDECDVNNIMRAYEKTGVIDHFNTHQGDYGNFIGFDDYHTSLNAIHEAQEAFETIPSKIRARFGNDASAFLKFAQDPENLDEMVKMGLSRDIPPKETPADQPETPPTAPAGVAEAVAEPPIPAEAPKPHTRTTPL